MLPMQRQVNKRSCRNAQDKHEGEHRLELAVARVQQWRVEDAGPSDAWLAKGSTAGQRAIRVDGRGPWLWVPSTALQPAAAVQATSKRSAGAVSFPLGPSSAAYPLWKAPMSY